MMTSVFDKKAARRVFADITAIDWSDEGAKVALSRMCDRFACAPHTIVPPSREDAGAYNAKIREIWKANKDKLNNSAPSAQRPRTGAPYLLARRAPQASASLATASWASGAAV